MSNNSKYVPDYKFGNLRWSDRICAREQEDSKAGYSETLKGKLFRKVDVLTAIVEDRIAHEHFDVVIEGSDMLVNIIAANVLVQSGKRVLINYKRPTGDDPFSHGRLQEMRDEMYSYELSCLLSKFSNIEPSKEFQTCLANLSSKKVYGHDKNALVPIVNTKYDFRFYNSKSGELEGYHLIKEGGEPKDFVKDLLVNLPKLELLNADQVEQPRNTFKNLRFVMTFDHLIQTSHYDVVEHEVNDDRVIKIAGAVRSTHMYDKFGVAERLYDIEDAYGIMTIIDNKSNNNGSD